MSVIKEVIEISKGKFEEITISEDRATELVNAICENNSKGIDLYFANCELITELRNSNGFYKLGYPDFNTLANELFESGLTQAKNMCLIAQSYGKRNDDGSYTIVDKEVLKNFSATQLLYIRDLKEFNGNLLETIDKYGIKLDQTVKENKVSCATLRALVAKEKDENKFISLVDFLTPPQIEDTTEDTTEPTEDTTETTEDTTEPTEDTTEPTEPTEETNETSDKDKLADYERMKNDYERCERVATVGADAIGKILIILDGNDSPKNKCSQIKELIMSLKVYDNTTEQ